MINCLPGEKIEFSQDTFVYNLNLWNSHSASVSRTNGLQGIKKSTKVLSVFNLVLVCLKKIIAIANSILIKEKSRSTNYASRKSCLSEIRIQAG